MPIVCTSLWTVLCVRMFVLQSLFISSSVSHSLHPFCGDSEESHSHFCTVHSIIGGGVGGRKRDILGIINRHNYFPRNVCLGYVWDVQNLVHGLSLRAELVYAPWSTASLRGP